MSRKDYYKMAKKNKEEVVNTEIQETVVPMEFADVIESEPVTEVEPESAPTIMGAVFGCDQLNVREAPNADADVLTVIKKNTEVMIDETESTDDFYKVSTASGKEGFCMKQFIAIQ